jgi:hypothetical protein
VKRLKGIARPGAFYEPPASVDGEEARLQI